jgi:hypothetical protein
MVEGVRAMMEVPRWREDSGLGILDLEFLIPLCDLCGEVRTIP